MREPPTPYVYVYYVLYVEMFDVQFSGDLYHSCLKMISKVYSRPEEKPELI